MKSFLFPIISAALLLAACSEAPESQAANTPMAVDLVCKYNGDLACVMVPAAAQTPHWDYQGTTYYFCSETCKTAFIKDPARYLPKDAK